MERRNYAVMLLFVFAIVDVYGELYGQQGSSTDELRLHSHLDKINDPSVAGESHQQGSHANGLSRTKRYNPPKNRTPARPVSTTESPAVVAARQRAEREHERCRLVQQFQASIQDYVKQGVPRQSAIHRTISDNPTKAHKIVELSVDISCPSQ